MNLEIDSERSEPGTLVYRIDSETLNLFVKKRRRDRFPLAGVSVGDTVVLMAYDKSCTIYLGVTVRTVVYRIGRLGAYLSELDPDGEIKASVVSSIGRDR